MDTCKMYKYVPAELLCCINCSTAAVVIVELQSAGMHLSGLSVEFSIIYSSLIVRLECSPGNARMQWFVSSIVQIFLNVGEDNNKNMF